MSQTCIKCGAHGRGVFVYKSGLCVKCDAEKEARENAEFYAENYHVCKAGKAKPAVQRIYDAFVRQYPDALITGIGVQNGGERLLVYLDGTPSYTVTFDPLTNGVTLVKVESPSTAAPVAAAPKEPSYFPPLIFSIFALAYGLWVHIGSSTPAGLVGIAASLIALAGCASKSKPLAALGACLMLISPVLSFFDGIGYCLLSLLTLLSVCL